MTHEHYPRSLHGSIAHVSHPRIALQGELVDVRAQGYAINDQQTFLGHRSVAIPLQVDGHTVAALLAGSQVSNVTVAMLRAEHLVALRAAAAQMAQLAATMA